MKILIVVGTRPNFIKVTQFPKVLARYADLLSYKIVHTGQHFDTQMAKVFFEQFKLEPDIYLGIGQGTPNTQMAQIMLGLEKEIEVYQPDLMLVVGDVNSTAAAALTANKMGIKLAHVESGLRSLDRGMPEELNRIITDELADYYFVTEESGLQNLLKEGKNEENIFFVGNTMIDTLVAFDASIDASPILEKTGVTKGAFILMTMHRPATVDNREGVLKLLEVIRTIVKKYQVVFPIHFRTLKNLEKMGLSGELEAIPNLILAEPLDYFAFQKLMKEAKLVVTDSGGIQEETTFRKVPCLTLRPNTERPCTVTIGTNELIEFDAAIVDKKIDEIDAGTYKNGSIPPFWDGKATERIVDELLKLRQTT